MIYQIFREESDIKYDLPNVIKVKNVTTNAEMYGDISTYDCILKHAKKNKHSIVGIYQARRCLTLNSTPLDFKTVISIDPNKIYHTTFFSLDKSNIALWEASHPSIKDALYNTMMITMNTYPEYINSIELFTASNVLFPHNMFIMPIIEFEKYLTWLKTILNKVNIDSNCGVPKPYSLLAERLFTVWCIHNYMPKDQIFTTANVYDKVTGKVKDSFNGIGN